MADKIIQGLYTDNDLLGAKKYATVTGTGITFPISGGSGGMLFNVVINKGFTGSVTMVDQATLASTTEVVGLTATSASEATTIPDASLTDPDYPRRLVVTPGGTTNDVAACTIVVSGTDVYGNYITENFTFAANAASGVNGSKRFKTVNQVYIPAQDGGSATFSVGSRAGDSIATIENPTTGQVYEYQIELLEGLKTTQSDSGSVTYTYLGTTAYPIHSISPSVSPSISPSVSPSASPSVSPSVSPVEESFSPSTSPSISPSVSVSISPSVSVSISPSISPSASPSISPSVSVSISPSASPSLSYSVSISPSTSPSISSSYSPSVSPSISPSVSLPV